MKNLFYLLIAFLALVTTLIVGSLIFISLALENFPGIDHYTYLDREKRYEMSFEEELDLYDNLRQISIVADIVKYIQLYPYIYLVRGNDPQRSAAWSKDFNAQITYYINDPNTGEELEFENFEDIPRYTILNYVTGEARQYKTIEEVPEADRLMFEQPVTEDCIIKRTCYSKYFRDPPGL